MQLTPGERAWLDGRDGDGPRLALQLVVRLGALVGAERLLAPGGEALS